uniref:Uncharacterized protein LOC116305883 n=1 Tax=Actinia tenebrosa TaxID=6105 RepID=A0A6P8J1Z0_ACTTE
MDFICSEFQDLVKNVLKKNQSKKGSTEMLTTDIVDALLERDFEFTTASDPLQSSPNISPLTGENHYPMYPLYKEIANKLFKWMETTQNPSESLQSFELLEQTKVVSLTKKEDLENVGKLLNQLKDSWKNWNVEEREIHIAKVFGILDKRMLLDLLGVRHTVGSIDFFPPPLEELINSFCKKHKPNSNLSVGARALSKHCHRDNTSKFWGVCTGSEDAKNNHACTTLHKILNDVAWINIHSLPHDVKVVEIRCSQGYGARWLHDGSEFRGFLEPQMVDGHSVKWRH